MKVAYLAENTGSVARPWTLGGNSLMSQTGHNIGNLAFWYAAGMLFDADLHLVGWHTKASQVPADVTALVIPAANFINETADLSRLAGLVRELDRPVFLLGIGAQAEVEDRPPQVKPSVIEFLQEVSKRTPVICVRGEYTEKLCKDLGISNTIVLGCPSILINSNPKLGDHLAKRIATLSDGPLAVHAACVKHSVQSVERELVRFTQINPGSSYVVQRPVELIMAARGEPMGEAEAAYFGKCATFFGFEGNTDLLTQYLRSHIYIPDSVDSWIHYLQTFAASVNTRIHGTLMSVAAGIPTVCICHDTRTRELALQLRVPHVSVKQFLDNRYSIRDVLAQSSFNGEAFDENRASTASAYVRITREIGLRPSKHLLSLASGEVQTRTAA